MIPPILSITVPNGAKIVGMTVNNGTLYVATETSIYVYEHSRYGWVLSPIFFSNEG